MLEIFLSATYLYPTRLMLHRQLNAWRLVLGRDGGSTSVRAFHQMLTEALIGTRYVILLDDVRQSDTTFVPMYSRRAFDKLLNARSGAALLGFDTDSWQFCDAGMQILAHLRPGGVINPPKPRPNNHPENPEHPG